MLHAEAAEVKAERERGIPTSWLCADRTYWAVLFAPCLRRIANLADVHIFLERVVCGVPGRHKRDVP